MIDWHSERFKKFAVWLMAVLAALFLVTGFSYSSVDFVAIFQKMGSFLGVAHYENEFQVKVFGREANIDEYDAFTARWKEVVAAESRDHVALFMRVYGPFGATPVDAYLDYFGRAFYYMPSKPLQEGFKNNNLDKVLNEYYDNCYCRYKEAGEMGIVVSDRRVDEVIQANPMFQNPDPLSQQKGFSENQFMTWLNLTRLAEQTYRQFLKERLMIQELEGMCMGRRLQGNLPISPLKVAEDYYNAAEQRRVMYFKANILSFMDSARGEVERQGETNPDDKKLKEYYKNAPQYIPARKVSGDYLYINLAKLIAEMEAKGIVNKDDIEKEIRSTAADIDEDAARKFYEENKSKLYRKPPTEGESHPAKNPDQTTAAPPATPTAAPPTAPSAARLAEKAPQYIPFVLPRVKEDLIKHKIEESLRQKSLDALYKQLEDYINEANSVRTRDIAKATFRDVSAGNFLEKLAGFLKASLADARNREVVADLKAFADRYPPGIVEYSPAMEPFSKDDAEKAPRIGGKDLARVPSDLFIKNVRNYHFENQKSMPYEDRKICEGGISGFLTPADENFRFVIRIFKAEEGRRPDFATLTEEQKNNVKKDYFEEKVKEEAYKQLYTHLQADEKDVENPLFDFSKDAKNLEADELKYRNSHLHPGEEPGKSIEDFIKQTTYFDKTTTEIPDISEEDRTAFIQRAFELLPDGKNSTVVARIRDPQEGMPKAIDTDKTFFYVLKLTDEKPILHPSFKQFDKKKPELLQQAIADMRDGEAIRQDRFDAVKANFFKKGEEQKEQQQRRRQAP